MRRELSGKVLPLLKPTTLLIIGYKNIRAFIKRRRFWKNPKKKSKKGE
jgi:hypothetical protein